MEEKLTPIQKINNKVKSFRGLKCVVQFNYEGIIEAFED
jgi:hypothetical protein